MNAMSERVVIVAPDGEGSLAGYARSLARFTAAPTAVVKGCSGSFGRRLLGSYSLRCLAGDAAVVRRLRALDAPLLHFTNHHLARYGPVVGTPYVVTVHDLMRHRDRLDGGRREPLIHEPNLRDRLYLRADAAGLRRAAALIAVSEHTKRELIELLELPAERIAVVREGVDREAFHAVAKCPMRDPYVLYVGSEQPRKNLGTLFRAFMRVRCAVPGLRLVKVGAAGGPEAPFRKTTLDQARAAGALPHLVVADRVSHDELLGWYSGALCLVQPSRHEGFGLTPLEAMACGCPVVASSGGALPEVVGDAGIVYGRPDDVDALAWELSRLLSSAPERAALARAGRERAAAFSWARTAVLTRGVWRRVLAGAASADARRSKPAPIGQTPQAAHDNALGVP